MLNAAATPIAPQRSPTRYAATVTTVATTDQRNCLSVCPRETNTQPVATLNVPTTAAGARVLNIGTAIVPLVAEHGEDDLVGGDEHEDDDRHAHDHQQPDGIQVGGAICLGALCCSLLKVGMATLVTGVLICCIGRRSISYALP